ncbi:MAG: LysM peptidoglycan-binding domain-containing protein [Bdellovibrionia bacterium]
MKRQIKKAAICALMMLPLTACSSSGVKDEADGGEDISRIPSDAGTDALPKPSAELEGQGASTAAPVSFSGESMNYTVQAGDTLMKIAFETYGDLSLWRRILEKNRSKISSPGALREGIVLELEKPQDAVVIERNGEKYQIQPGDTLGKIANSVYGTPKKWKKIWQNNPKLIRDPNKIYAGFLLYYVQDESLKAQNQSQISGSQQVRFAPTPSGIAPETDAQGVSAPVPPSAEGSSQNE